MLTENLNFFKSHYPHWLEKINEASPNFRYEIIKTKSGDPTLYIEKDHENTLFHSKYNPLKEAEKLLDSTVKKDIEVLIIGGFAFAYLVEKALEKYQNCEIVVCELDWSILKLASENRSLSHILNNPRVHFVISDNPQAIIEILKSFKTPNVQLLIHQPSQKLHPKYFESLKKAVDYFQNSKEINIATLNRFQKLWTKNILKNLVDFVSYKGIESLFNQFEKVPVVIVAAGPSLNKNIHLLKKVKGKFIIIAVDTVFQILQAHDIDPDFVIAVDPQDINKKYFDNIKKSNAILICEPSISPKIVREYTGRKLMLGSLFHLVEWLETLTQKKGNIEIGGSVATAAYGMALKLGCDPIIFLGLDLAYSNNETHMKGAYFEENWIYSWNRFENNYSRSYSFLKGFGLFNVKGAYKDTVKSDRKFRMFQKWFESQFRKADRTIINATEGGAFIEHCESKSFDEVIKEYSQNTNPKSLDTLKLFDTLEESYKDQLKQVFVEIQKTLTSFQKLKEEVTKGKKLSDDLYACVLKSVKYKKPLPKYVNDIYKELDAIDNMLTSDSTLNALISITIQSIINEIDSNSTKSLNEMEKKHKDLKIAKHSLKLYEGVLEGLDYNIDHFNRTVIKIERFLL